MRQPVLSFRIGDDFGMHLRFVSCFFLSSFLMRKFLVFLEPITVYDPKCFEIFIFGQARKRRQNPFHFIFRNKYYELRMKLMNDAIDGHAFSRSTIS